MTLFRDKGCTGRSARLDEREPPNEYKVVGYVGEDSIYRYNNYSMVRMRSMGINRN